MINNINYIRSKINAVLAYFDNLSIPVQPSEIDNILNQAPQSRFTNNKYRSIIEFIISKSKLPNQDLLIDLFSNLSILSISSYRKFLDYKALDEWESYRNKNYRIYNNLFLRLNESLKAFGLNSTIKDFDSCIKTIEKNTDKTYQQIVILISEYYYFLKANDQFGLSNAASNLKSLIRIFNRNSKLSFINTYTDDNIEKIKDSFKININFNYGTTKRISLEQFYNIIINDNELRNIIKIYILEKFHYTADNDELLFIIKNILNDNDQKNLELFNIEASTKLFLLKINKSFNRIKRNYITKINNYFDVSKINIINDYLQSDIVTKQELKKNFTNEELLFLESLIPIVKEVNAVFINNNGLIDVISRNKILTNDERRELKKNEIQLNNYNGLKKIILKSYYLQCKAVKNIIEENKVMLNMNNITFTDDNYTLGNNEYLFNFNLIARIILGIDKDSLQQYSLNNNNYKQLKKLLIRDGLLACVLQDNDNETLITDIINNLPSTLKNIPNLDASINNLNDIVSKTKLSIIIDEETVDLLGFDEKIIERLNKAKDLMIRAKDIDKSAIPYFDPITINNVTLERYRNDDPNILTSGIDSNTCFKISANDNDYLFYSILNKNGMVAKFVTDNKMIGRITAHRLNNVLLINGIRTIENDYQATSLTKLQRNNTIIDLVIEFANTIIALTENSDCPIDFVASNKAGILESSDYDNKFTILPSHLFTNPIDCYNEDFEEFKNMYDNKKQYLQETPYYNGGGQAPFTTDFGHYPVVLIASRNGKFLERKMDISYNSPQAIYSRPKENIEKIKIKTI